MYPRIAGDYPHQPTSTAQEREHPRYRDYMTYRASMSAQLVTGECFALWLKHTEEFEQGSRKAFQPNQHCDRSMFVPGMWYAHIYAPRSRKAQLRGPFATRAEAESQ